MLKTATILPLTGIIGAEIQGIALNDLVRDNDHATAKALCNLLTEKKVLVLRDQHPDHETHIGIGKLLGTLAPPQPMYPKVDGYEDIIIVRNDDNNPPENEVWHADMSYLSKPFFASVLHGVHIPPAGGDTLRVKWQPGTVVIWDNWATQHFACSDHYPSFREMQRVTVGAPF